MNAFGCVPAVGRAFYAAYSTCCAREVSVVQYACTTITTSGLDAHRVPVVTLDNRDDAHRPGLYGCMVTGFSFFHCVASPFHSFVTIRLHVLCETRYHWKDRLTEKGRHTHVRDLVPVYFQAFPGNTRVSGTFLHSLTPRPKQNIWLGCTS